MSKIESFQQMIDATIAQEYLLFNRPYESGLPGINRKINNKTVAKYASAMLRGEWEVTHQGIALSSPDPETGEVVLLDGQHRLKAVLQAAQVNNDIQVPFLVTTGLPFSSREMMDTGKIRKLADFAAMDGHVNAANISASTRLVYLYWNRPWDFSDWSDYRLTPVQQRDLLNEHGEELQISYHLVRPFVKFIPPSGVCAAVFLARHAGFADEVKYFLSPLAQGELLAKDDPRLRFRNWHLNKMQPGVTRHQLICFAIAVKALGAFLSSENVKALSFGAGRNEEFPRLPDKAKVDALKAARAQKEEEV